MDPRPSGHGVSKLHPGDHEILRHPAVLLAKDFEAPTLEDLKPRWNEIENQQNKVLELVSAHPAASQGK